MRGIDSFIDLLKKNLAVVTAILSLLSLTIGFYQSFSAHVRAATIILLVTGTTLLIFYNVWMTVAIQPSSLDPSVKRRRFGRRFKLTAYIVSALILILCWTAVGITTSHKYFGYALFSLGKYELAVQHFESYLQESKKDYRVFYELAKSYEMLGNYKAQIETLEELLQNDTLFNKLDEPTRTWRKFNVHYEIAVALLGAEYIEGIPNPGQKALIHIEQARLLNRNHPGVLWLTGLTKASNKNDLPVVERIFQNSKKAIEQEGISKQDYKFFMSQNHYWFGKSLLKIEMHDRAQEELNAGLAIINDDPELRNRYRDMFLFLLGQNEFGRTLDPHAGFRYWRDISNDEYLGTTLTTLGLAYWVDGVKASWRGDKEKAEEKFDAAEGVLATAKKLGVSTWDLYHTLGMIYFSREDYINAAANFDESTKVSPSKSLGFYWLGRANYFIKGGMKKAQKAMVRAAELDPNDARTHYWLARILGDIGDMPGAIEELKKSIQIDSNFMEAYGYLIAAIFDLSSKKEQHSDEQISMRETAIKYVQTAVATAKKIEDESWLETIEGMQATIFKSLAYSYAERGEALTLAARYIENALELRPQDPRYLDTKAWILVRTVELADDLTPSQKQRRYDEAEDLLNQSLNSLFEGQNEAKAEVFFHMGYLDKLRGRYEKARDYFLRALEADPKYQKARKQLQ